MWKRRTEPTIGHLNVNDVSEYDAGAVVRSTLRLDAKGQVVGGKAEAGNLYRVLHHLLHKALQWRMRAKELGNPLEGVGEPKVKRRERLLSGGEIGALIQTLDAAKADGRRPSGSRRRQSKIRAQQEIVRTGRRTPATSCDMARA